MTDLNHVVIIGRVVRDLDEKTFGYTSNGNARAMLSVAVNRSKKVGENWENEVSYIDVTIWGKTAENLKPYLNKGKLVAIDGYLHQERWEKDGKKNSRLGVVANNVQLLGGNGNGSGNDGSAAANTVAKVFEGEIVSNGDDFPEGMPF